MSHNNISLFIPHRGCPHRCSFCDQKAISGKQRAVTPLTVLETLKNAFEKPLSPDETEIAFFGGSFTCLPKEEMVAYLNEAYPYVAKGLCGGIRLSTRPDGVDEEILSLLSRYGVTTIELGAQSMDDRVLQKNKRGHTAKDTVLASERVRSYGFSLVLQTMVGLCLETEESAYETARKVISLRPDGVRIYPALVLEGTMLADWYREGSYCPLSLKEGVALTAKLMEMYQKANIPVLKVGLHAEKELEKSYLAGPYHPAFRELCLSACYYRVLADMLKTKPKGTYTVLISPKDRSAVVGQKRENIDLFRGQGYELHFVEEKNRQRGEISLMEGEEAHRCG